MSKQIYAKISQIARRYGLSIETIKRKLSTHALIEGEHYIHIDNIKLYDIDAIHALLTQPTDKLQKAHKVLEKLKLDNIVA